MQNAKKNDILRLPIDALDDGPVGAKVGDRFIGVFDVGEKMYAIENVCPHAQAFLSDGHVQGAVVECALHNARFHISTGKCLSGPGRDIATFPVRVTRDQIIVECESNKQ